MSDPPKTTEAIQPKAAPLGDEASADNDHETQLTVERPIGDGHMPLGKVALWIATKGGTIPVTSGDKEQWEAAFDALLNALSSGKVQCVGRRDGEMELIPGEKWVRCPVDYIAAGWHDQNLSDEFYLNNEMYLETHAVFDRVDWPKGICDLLISRVGNGWSDLWVLKSDVAAIWPFAPEAPGTGAPGRPSSMHLVKAEHQSRLERNVALKGVNDEAEQLSNWLTANHPAHPPATRKTIANNIRKEHSCYFSKSPKL